MSDDPARMAWQDVVWVHAFEQDTPAGAVFVPSDAELPLTRRPRLRFVLHEDRSAEIATAGADDRPAGIAAHWNEEGAGVVVASDDGRQSLRVIEHRDDHLVVQILRSG